MFLDAAFWNIFLLWLLTAEFDFSFGMPEKLCGMVLLTIFRKLWELKIVVDLLQKNM